MEDTNSLIRTAWEIIELVRRDGAEKSLRANDNTLSWESPVHSSVVLSNGCYVSSYADWVATGVSISHVANVTASLVGMVLTEFTPGDPRVSLGVDIAAFRRQLEDIFPQFVERKFSNGVISFFVDPLSDAYLEKLLPIFPTSLGQKNWEKHTKNDELRSWHIYVDDCNMGAYVWKTG
jgi:hypothetical protein